VTLATTFVTVDSWASEARIADTHGPDPVLVLAEASNARKWVYMKPPPPWASGRAVTVQSAKLRLRLAVTNPSAATTIRVRRIEETWSASTLAWKRRPAVSAADDATVVVAGSAAAGTLVEIDLTAAMQAVADGAPYFGFRLILDPGVTRGPLRLVAASGKPVENRPEFAVDWNAPPDVPTRLAPTGARYVSTTKPVLSWQFGDATERDPKQSAFQVQVDDAADFATPTFDTGQVVSGTNGLDLAATAYGGLPTDGSVRWWRVRVADASSTWSPYSDPVQFRYSPLGVVAITAPGATTPDLAPTVVWTFTPSATGGAQKVWRARIDRQVGTTWQNVADSGDVAGTDLSWSPPRPLPFVAATYRAVVEVLDSVDREARGSASDRATATRQFTWVAGGAIAAPAALTATVLEGAFVRLNWTRATPPDHFILVADGIVVEDNVDPVPTGTAYEFVWYGARPREVHALQLHAVDVTGGVTATSPPASVTVETEPTGVWLVDAADGRAVHIAGKDALGGGIGESSSLHPRIGDRAPVLVTEVVRGYEVEVSGVLVDWDGRIARDGKETLIDLRETGVRLRLILGDLNLPVVIFDVTANPTPDVEDTRFQVGFDAVQVGEFDRL
jgi:hypothetical protein